MRKIILAATCVAFIGGISAASAQSTGPSGQTTAQTGENLNANAMSMGKKEMMMMRKKKMMNKKMMMKKKGMM